MIDTFPTQAWSDTLIGLITVLGVNTSATRHYSNSDSDTGFRTLETEYKTNRIQPIMDQDVCKPIKSSLSTFYHYSCTDDISSIGNIDTTDRALA